MTVIINLVTYITSYRNGTIYNCCFFSLFFPKSIMHSIVEWKLEFNATKNIIIGQDAILGVLVLLYYAQIL